MLKYKVNMKSLNLTSNKLECIGISHDKKNITIKQNSRHILPIDKIRFRRSRNNSIFFEEEVIINKVDNNTIEIPVYNDYEIKPFEVYGISLPILPFDTSSKKAICFKFPYETKHNFIDESKYDSITISDNITSEEKYWLNPKKRCNGDYVLYNDIFLLKTVSTDEKGEYIFEEKIYNVTHDVYFYKDKKTLIVLKDCIVPVMYNTYDDRTALYWIYNEDDKEIYEYIVNNYNNIKFMTVDDRFYILNNDGTVNFITGKFGNEEAYSSLYIDEGNTDICVPFCEGFETNMLQNEKIDLYAEEIINENINKVVDMEKQIFTPVLVDENNKITSNNIDSIKINLKFRGRYDKPKIGDFSNTTKIESIIKGWENDNAQNYWNGGKEGVKSDLIGFLGFTDEDVYYRKKNLKKSFIRLSFYDKKTPSNQSLLFYSTIFFDSGKLYGKYSKNVTNGADKNNIITLTDIGVNSDIIERIDSSFIIKNTYDKYNSSEGFYLYLFPNLCNGIKQTDIYMKVEFNHAKFGKTIPMVLPKNGIVKDYYIDQDNDNAMIGIKELFDDLYIKIGIRYDKENNRYIWYINNEDKDVNGVINNIKDNALNLTLYEPIVNKDEENGEDN